MNNRSIMKPLCTVIVLLLCTAKDSLAVNVDPKVNGVTFLVTVNDTWKWNPPIQNDTCMVTIKTESLSPDMPLNKSHIMVGDCDSGPLVYSVRKGGSGEASIYLTFHSSVIEDASPPICDIQWDYSYLIPQGPSLTEDSEESLLPGCFTADSREGYHMTYYWFYLLDWSLASEDKFVPKYPTDPQAASLTFLIAVNQTETGCLSTTKTPPLQSGIVHNASQYIHVGKCDYGALDFNVTQGKDGKGQTHTYVELVFHSHDIEDASPPTCKIQWDYSYRVPTDANPKRSLLPGCYTSESREGAHMTYYWFYVLEW